MYVLTEASLNILDFFYPNKMLAHDLELLYWCLHEI